MKMLLKFFGFLDIGNANNIPDGCWNALLLFCLHDLGALNVPDEGCCTLRPCYVELLLLGDTHAVIFVFIRSVQNSALLVTAKAKPISVFHDHY